MKYLLILSMVFSLPALAAGDGSALASTATDVAVTKATTDTSTDSGPPPAGTPAKAALREKFTDDWKVTKGNDDLLVDERIKGKTGKDVNVSQEETYSMASEVFVQCAEVSSEGRKDEVCANDPTNPECAGVDGSVANATNCLEYFTPKSLGCKTYGTAEYSQVEWFAVGDLFVDKIKDCKATKEAYDAKIKDSVKLDNLTEMIGAGNYLQTLSSPPSMKGSSYNPSSQVSGDIKSDLELGSLEWDSLASRVKDGGSRLGYQDGDIIRAALKGESFASIVTKSPFVKNQLNYEQKARLEEGLADSKMISQRVVQSYRERSGAGMAGADAPAGGDQAAEIQIAAGDANAPTGAEEPNAGGSAAPGGQAAAGGAEAQPYPKQNTGGVAAAQAAAGNRAMLEAERQEAVAAAAALARSEKRPYRAPASVAQSRVEDLLHTTLFQRISQTYRRKSSGLKNLDTRAGDLIRSIEKPEIFRNL